MPNLDSAEKELAEATQRLRQWSALGIKIALYGCVLLQVAAALLNWTVWPADKVVWPCVVAVVLPFVVIGVVYLCSMNALFAASIAYDHINRYTIADTDALKAIDGSKQAIEFAKGTKDHAVRLVHISMVVLVLYVIPQAAVFKSRFGGGVPSTGAGNVVNIGTWPACNGTRGLMHLATIDSLPVGEACPTDTAALTELAQGVANALNDRERQAALVYIVGGADKRPLAGTVAERWGDNLNLSLARAGCVRKAILKALPAASPAKDRMLMLGGGATNTGGAVPPALLAADRSVSIYVLWQDR